MRIRFCGVGGQGIIKAAYIFGNAAVIDGYKVVQTRTYGSAYRGMLSKSDVIISKKPIYELEFIHPDILVCFSQKGYKTYREGIHPEGLLFIDSDLVQLDIPHPHIYKLNASVLSYERFGSKIFSNMIVMGYLIAIAEPISKESMEKSISQKSPNGTEKENLEAFEIGYSIGLERGSRI